jgi:hypothetical protein
LQLEASHGLRTIPAAGRSPFAIMDFLAALFTFEPWPNVMKAFLEQLRCIIRRSGRPDLIIAAIASILAWMMVQFLKAILG